MKAKKGYRRDKRRSNIGRWLKWYFVKRTCRKWKESSEGADAALKADGP